MKSFVYILQSEKTHGYYVGQSEDVSGRLIQHNSPDNVHYTFRDRPWILRAKMECLDRSHAMRLEAFIKKQKSRTFIEKIISSEEVRNSIIQKFLDC